jgi:hypothetical protein
VRRAKKGKLPKEFRTIRPVYRMRRGRTVKGKPKYEMTADWEFEKIATTDVRTGRDKFLSDQDMSFYDSEVRTEDGE